MIGSVRCMLDDDTDLNRRERNNPDQIYNEGIRSTRYAWSRYCRKTYPKNRFDMFSQEKFVELKHGKERKMCVEFWKYTSIGVVIWLMAYFTGILLTPILK